MHDPPLRDRPVTRAAVHRSGESPPVRRLVRRRLRDGRWRPVASTSRSALPAHDGAVGVAVEHDQRHGPRRRRARPGLAHRRERGRHVGRARGTGVRSGHRPPRTRPGRWRPSPPPSRRPRRSPATKMRPGSAPSVATISRATPAISDGSPASRCLVAGLEPVPVAHRVRRARLLGVGDQERVALGELVHPGGGGEVVGALGAAVQHHDQRRGRAGVTSRWARRAGTPAADRGVRRSNRAGRGR